MRLTAPVEFTGVAAVTEPIFQLRVFPDKGPDFSLLQRITDQQDVGHAEFHYRVEGPEFIPEGPPAIVHYCGNLRLPYRVEAAPNERLRLRDRLLRGNALLHFERGVEIVDLDGIPAVLVNENRDILDLVRIMA